MRLLITGVSGQVGSEVLRLSEHENYGVYFSNEPKHQNENILKLDIRDRYDVFNMVEKIKPDCIIHCAAATKVDWCETNREQAWKINVVGTKNLVDATKKVNSKFLYVSTDCVFDGQKGNYKETDETKPTNFHGKTKLEGELIVKRLQNFLIMRTSLVYSIVTDNFVLWVLEKMKSSQIESPYDMISSPTSASELAEAILKAIKKDLNGVYHSAGNEQISRYDFARKIAKVFDYGDSNINPIEIKDLNFAAKRPKNSSLDISKILNEGIEFSDANNALKKLKKQMKTLGL